MNHGYAERARELSCNTLVLATPDGSAAIVALSAHAPSSELSGYVHFYFNEGQAAATTSKWTILRAYYSVQPQTLLHVIAGLCIGHLTTVAPCMFELDRRFGSEPEPSRAARLQGMETLR